MKTPIEYSEVQWIWHDKPVKISNLKTKDLKYLRFMVKVKSDSKPFWFGLHCNFWLEVFDNEIAKRKKEQESIVNPKPISKKQVAKAVNRFLGNITNDFPNSNLAKSIKQSQIKSNSLNKSSINS